MSPHPAVPRSVLAISTCGLSIVFSVLPAAAGGPGAWPRAQATAAVPAPRDVEQRVFLVGDAGVPRPRDPVLAALARDVAAAPSRSLVVYLGDNVYPRGLPPLEAAERARAERYLEQQMAVAGDGARAIFVPGNHDWHKHGREGWDAVRRQGQHLDGKRGGAISFLPAGGCPGPVVRDFGARLRLVLLDTQWWLHRGPKPQHPDSPCAEDSAEEVLGALASALREAGGRSVVVAGHHPLASAGPHGGRFSWRDHLFPLRALDKRLWLPLPGIGSLYPFSRSRGVSPQDLAHAANRRMRAGLARVFAGNPPLAYAAGHEHNLQVIRGPGGETLLVSGAGAYGHLSQVGWTPDTLYAAAKSGYMRLDVAESGRVRLAVITVDARKGPIEALGIELAGRPAGAPGAEQP